MSYLTDIKSISYFDAIRSTIVVFVSYLGLLKLDLNNI
jgi:hypothetical protein